MVFKNTTRKLDELAIMVRENNEYPLKIRKATGSMNIYKSLIRCPKIGRFKKYSCGKDRCRYFMRRLSDICYCTHPDAKKYVEVDI